MNMLSRVVGLQDTEEGVTTPLHGIRVSLRFKFVFYFLPVILLIIIGALTGIVWLNYGGQEELLRTRAQLVARLQAAALAKPMWELDTIQIIKLVRALETDPSFLGSAIVDSQNGTILGTREFGAEKSYRYGRIAPEDSNIRIEEPIVFFTRNKRQELGRLVLVLSTQTIDETLKHSILIVCIAFSILTISAISLVLLMLQSLVLRPLDLILGAIDDVERKRWATVEWHSRDELGQLVTLFNQLVGSLEAGDLAQNQLKDSEERYALAMRGANDGLWDWDLRSNKMYFSPRWNAMLGLEEVGATLSEKDWLNRIHPEDRDRVRREIESHLTGRTPAFTSEHRVLHRDGSYRWMLGRGLGVRDNRDLAYRMAGSLTDITERKRAEEALLHNAFHDTLTGMPNRALMMDRISVALARQRQDVAHNMALLFIDFDRFKMVNDSLGHMAGDQMLVICAQRLQSCLRETDTIARFGGDEFVILLEDMPNESLLIKVANSIHAQLSAPIKLLGQEIFTSASIGIVFGGIQYEKPEDMLRDADIALYEAKATGRSKHVVFDTHMHVQAVNILKIDAELRRAIERNEIEVFYQPLIDQSTGALSGFEALSRWRHPERGMVSPVDFIPLAEETGLINAIGEYVTETVCHQMSDWAGKYARACDLSIAINCSPVELIDGKYSQRLENIINRQPINRHLIKIEVTESAIMQDTSNMVQILNQIKELGVRLWIDDFGTGHSSLGQLDKFPFHGIKIDQSFVSAQVSEIKSRPQISKPQLIRVILALAENMEVETVAEGIETMEQYAQLRMLGVNFGQGFLYSPPVVKAQAEKFIRNGVTWECVLESA